MKGKKDPYPRLLGRDHPHPQHQGQAAEPKIGQGALGVKMLQSKACFCHFISFPKAWKCSAKMGFNKASRPLVKRDTLSL